MPEVTAFLIVTGLTILLVGMGVWRERQRYRAIQARLQAIRAQEQPLLLIGHVDAHWRIAPVWGIGTRWMRAIIAITHQDMIIYDRTKAVLEHFRCSHDQIRWFGRPKPYTSGHNDMWIHVETPRGWDIVQIRLYRDSMRDLVRMLKEVVDYELVVAYRRRRPYIHAGPVQAAPATQDIHGAWSLESPVHLYIMPRFLVIFQDKQIIRKFPLEQIQQIGALRRIDQPQANGLIRFQAGEEALAFALRDYETFAAQLAEAAKRTLEAPLERKQKGKDWDEDI
jgi:hypothetical protein